MKRAGLNLVLLAVAVTLACEGQLGPLGEELQQAPPDSGVFVVVPSEPLPDAGFEDAGFAALDAGETDAGLPLPDAGTPPCPALASRVTVTEIDVSPIEVTLGSDYPWSNNRPIHLAPLPDGSARVAWSGSDGAVHVTQLDANLQRVGPDFVVPGTDCRGLVAHADGHVVVLVRRAEKMALVRLAPDGTVVFDLTLIGDTAQTESGAKFINNWGHEGRMVWTGKSYALYFGHAMNWGAQGVHQGDLLTEVNTSGATVGGGWNWGCSHSLDVRLAHDGQNLIPVCLSDCYPQKAILYNHYGTLRAEPTGDCGGYSQARLGGLVAAPGGGFFLSFVSPEGRTTRDVGVLKADALGSPQWTKWLTNTAADEQAPHLARYGTRMLATWRDAAATQVAVVDLEGELLEGPVPVPVELAARDDLSTFPDGDVAWAHAWDDMTRLKVVRVRACE